MNTELKKCRILSQKYIKEQEKNEPTKLATISPVFVASCVNLICFL